MSETLTELRDTTAGFRQRLTHACMARHVWNRRDQGMASPGLVLLAAAGLLVGSACASKEKISDAPGPSPPSIATVNPTSTFAGKPFFRQPSGDSALIVKGASFVAGANVQFGTQTLQTTFANSGEMTAIVPVQLYEKPVKVSLTVRNPDGQISNAVIFYVRGTSELPPRLNRVIPDESVAARGFQVQPNGESALSIDGSEFYPGATVLFGDQALVTTFASPDGLTAIVPAGLNLKPRKVAVRVRNPDGKLSNALNFTIRAE